MTVGELIKELQRAVIVDELDWESEVLGSGLNPVRIHLRPTREEDGLRLSGHVVVY